MKMRPSVGNETRIQVAMIEVASSAFDLAIGRTFKGQVASCWLLLDRLLNYISDTFEINPQSINRFNKSLEMISAGLTHFITYFPGNNILSYSYSSIWSLFNFSSHQTNLCFTTPSRAQMMQHRMVGWLIHN
jgi:hypothetical protein